MQSPGAILTPGRVDDIQFTFMSAKPVNPAADRANSVGLVRTETATIALPPGGLRLQGGDALPELQVAYETYGRLSPARDNAILICHALSGDAHVAGYHDPADPKPGWWEEMVGPGKGIDTNRFFVVCSNILGGCKGSTGPSSVNPGTGRPYGSAFPRVTVGDMVDVQRLLLRHLGIDRLAGVAGGSLGGMQVLEWSIRYPDLVDRCICIASAASLSAQALAFDVVGRHAIMTDPGWNGGDYYGAESGPDLGLAQARMIGHITYLSPEIMERKFGREKREGHDASAKFATRFQVESYLQYQGRKFVDRFDANSYLHITEAIDTYDLKEAHGSLEGAFAPVRARFLVVALSSDWLYPPEQSIEIAGALLRSGKRVSYCLLHAPYGHDAFLIDIEHLSEMVRTFMSAPAAPPAGNVAPHCEVCHRDFQVVADMIEPASRVLDLGCGDGSLVAMLTADRRVSGLGVDIDLANVIGSVGRGIDVLQTDIDEGLTMIPDRSYDYAILSQTLQVVRRPRFVLHEMLRIAREGIVTFPNFANWANRLRLGLLGQMPKSSALPFEWYETPNIHLATLTDFMNLCTRDGIRIVKIMSLPQGPVSKLFVGMGLSNLGADHVLVKIARG